MSAFALKIVLPSSFAFDGEVEYIKFSSSTGEMMIYPGHESYICMIAPCEMEYKAKTGSIETLKVEQGFCKFEDNLCEIALTSTVSRQQKPK